jgi:type II secretory pathway component HofQ
VKINVTIPRLAVLSAPIAFALTSGAYGGPCSPAIDRLQARVDAALGARAGAGPSAPESTGALTHRQPTPGSIAAAEEKLGEVSAQRARVVEQAMARARAADSAGDKSACEQALADAEHAIGQ